MRFPAILVLLLASCAGPHEAAPPGAALIPHVGDTFRYRVTEDGETREIECSAAPFDKDLEIPVGHAPRTFPRDKTVALRDKKGATHFVFAVNGNEIFIFGDDYGGILCGVVPVDVRPGQEWKHWQWICSGWVSDPETPHSARGTREKVQSTEHDGVAVQVGTLRDMHFVRGIGLTLYTHQSDRRFELLEHHRAN